MQAARAQCLLRARTTRTRKKLSTTAPPRALAGVGLQFLSLSTEMCDDSATVTETHVKPHEVVDKYSAWFPAVKMPRYRHARRLLAQLGVARGNYSRAWARALGDAGAVDAVKELEDAR